MKNITDKNISFLNKKLAFAFAILFLSLFSASSANAQNKNFRVDYTIKVASVDGQLFHVTTDVKNINQQQLDLSLPIWTPGWYTIENYAKNILRFKITDDKGNRLSQWMTRKQTWRVDTKGVKNIRIEFDYEAKLLGLNQAKITKDWAFFTGTQLFLEAVGHRKSESTVRFEIPEGWKIISALKETQKPFEFTAPDYETLVDSPTQMGNFDVAQFEVEGKPHFFVTTPAGLVPKDKAVKATETLAKIIKAQSAIFGGLPYEKYVAFYFFARAETNASGGLEHNNSHISIVNPQSAQNPDNVAGLFSHEFFHTWNVKRIRPAEMFPYDYSRENETPSLWVSEGFTNYYGIVAMYRAGLMDEKMFLARAGGAAAGVEGNDARNYISPADSSTSTWLGYDTGTAFEISYYGQGQNLGALLDLSIRNDTKGEKGLDDVMRTLYKNFYEKQKGFTTEDLIGVFNNLTKRDYKDFIRRYVRGVEVPPYEQIFGYAGLKAEKKVEKQMRLGWNTRANPSGGVDIADIDPNGATAKAGLKIGDTVFSIDGMELKGGGLTGEQRTQLVGKIGQTVETKLKRGSENLSIQVTITGFDSVSYQITEVPSATPEQMKIRESWLKR